MFQSFKHSGINTTSAIAPVSVELKETKLKDVFKKVNTITLSLTTKLYFIVLLRICDLQATQSPIFCSTRQQEKCHKLVIMYMEGLLITPFKLH